MLGSSQISAQGYVDILPDEIQKPFRERYTRVADDIKGFHSNEWVGSYSRYVGETWSDVLIWTPENGFAAFRDTCSNGPRAWVNFGSAKFQIGLLILNSEQDYQGEHSLRVSQELTPVKWGHQRWLIPTKDLERFAYAVISGSWQDYGAYYLKDDGSDKEPKGLPEIPPQFRHILKRKPVTIKIVSVGGTQEKPAVDLTIDAGKDKGVIVGMSFWLLGARNTYVKIAVDKVNEKTSIARIIAVGYSYEYNDDGSPKGREPAEFVPEPGLRFTSRNPNPNQW